MDFNTTSAYASLKKYVHYGQSCEIQPKFKLDNLELRLGNFIAIIHLQKKMQ